MTIEYTASGKWILTGEHAVLRGHPALLFPLKNFFITLNYEADAGLNRLIIDSKHDEIQRFLTHAFAQLPPHQLSRPSGLLSIRSRLPHGCGLGASAALCVAVTRWFIHENWLESTELFSFARTLENYFHGESSGADIAVAASETPMLYQCTPKPSSSPLSLNWIPCFYLSYAGGQAKTMDCIKKVKQHSQHHPNQAHLIDAQMAQSTALALSALTGPLSDSKKSFYQLVEAIELAHNCFDQWGLLQTAHEKHIEALKKRGAIACKPTGSGGGGYIISLWSAPPPPATIQQLGLISPLEPIS